MEYVNRGSDPNDVAVLLEDAGAVGGVGLAAACLGLSVLTDNPAFDAMGSIAVGGLLGGIAVFLINRNRRFLVGQSIDEAQLNELTGILERDPVVSSVRDVMATYIGANAVRFKAQIYIDGEAVVRRYLDRSIGQDDMRLLLQQVQEVKSQKQLAEFFVTKGGAIVDSVGDEVDRIEQKIKKSVPEVRQVDLSFFTSSGRVL